MVKTIQRQMQSRTTLHNRLDIIANTYKVHSMFLLRQSYITNIYYFNLSRYKAVPSSVFELQEYLAVG